MSRAGLASSIRRNAMLVTAALMLIVTRIIASKIFPAFDDSYITLRYARNLANGLGFVFNRGEWVLGSSCPLFGILESTFFLFGLPMPQSLLVFNILIDVAVLIASMHLMKQFCGRPAAMVFALLFAASPTLARINVGCMELNLFLLLTIIAVWLFFNRVPFGGIALASLAFFLRPEVAILVSILIFWEWKRSSVISAMRLSLLPLIIIGSGLLLIRAQYGELLPESVTTKLGWSAGSFMVPIRGLFMRDPISVALLPFALWELFKIRNRGSILQGLLLFGGIVSLVYIVKRAAVAPWYAEIPQYCVVILASLSLSIVLKRIAVAFHFLRHRSLALTALMIPILIWMAAWAKMGNSKVTKNIYGSLQQWGQESHLQAASILANDIGAVGYYTDGEIIDVEGLTSHIYFRNMQEEVNYIHLNRPDFLFLVNVQDSYKLMGYPSVNSDYYVLRMVLQSSQDRTVGLRSNDWNQNYIILQRRP